MRHARVFPFAFSLHFAMAAEFSAVLSTFVYVFSSLIPVVDPVGGAILFWALTRGGEGRIRATLANRIGIYSFIVLLVCLYAGNFILTFFGISIGVLRVAGGIVLFSQGWQALNQPEGAGQQGPEKPGRIETMLSMAFYPLTLPLVTGPGAIAVSVAFGANSSKGWGYSIGCILGIAVTCIATWLCFRFCDKLNHAVGVAGADALARIFAFILICLGVVIFWQGFTDLWSQLPSKC